MVEVVVVVGMRGAGKSTLGGVGARALSVECVDMDEVLEASQGRSCGDVIAADGWTRFRELELAALRDTVAKQVAGGAGGVISCGGGVVETAEARAFLKGCGLKVIFVDRHIDDIVAYLESKEEQAAADGPHARRPDYGKSIRDVYAGRLPNFVDCCTHRFTLFRGDDDWVRVSAEFAAFARALFLAPAPSALVPGARLLVPASASASAAAVAPATSSGLHGFDGLWLGGSGERALQASALPEVIARARRAAVVPVLVDAADDAALVRAALQVCAQAVCIDVHAREALDAFRAAAAAAAGTTTALVLRGSELELELELQAQCLPKAAQMQIITRSVADDMAAAEVAAALRAAWRETRLASVLAPECTGAGLPLARRLVQGYCGPTFVFEGEGKGKGEEKKEEDAPAPVPRYCLVGGSIRSSPSPAMHNAGFRALGLRSEYGLCETLDVERIAAVAGSAGFGGASVTMPHKEVLQARLGLQLSDAAAAIGAVNTLVRRPDGAAMLGDNTDWFGIYQLAKGGLAARGQRGTEAGAGSGNGDGVVALVLGAGGTALAACYCVQQLGLKLLVWNRSGDKAKAVAKRFGGAAVENLADVKSVGLIVGTVPAQSMLKMPDEEVLRREQPVVIDVAYRPRQTELLKQAAACGCAHTYEGIDMLVEQGLQQMALWTGRDVANVPRLEMEAAARDFYADSDPKCERFFAFGGDGGALPAMHNAAFRHLRMTRIFDKASGDKANGDKASGDKASGDGDDVVAATAAMARKDFGGAVVEGDMQEALFAELSNVTPAAHEIEAVDTIVIDTNQRLKPRVGDNAEWRAMSAFYADHGVRGAPSNHGKTKLLIVGGGQGTTARAAKYWASRVGITDVEHVDDADVADAETPPDCVVLVVASEHPSVWTRGEAVVLDLRKGKNDKRFNLLLAQAQMHSWAQVVPEHVLEPYAS